MEERTDASDENSTNSSASSDGSIVPAPVRNRSRRQGLLLVLALLMVVIVLVVVALVPGPVLGLTVNDAATFEAAPAAPPKETVAAEGYTRTAAEVVVINRSLRRSGVERTIIARNHQRTFERTVAVRGDNVTRGAFVTVSTPAIEIAGRSQNPLADASARAILDRFKGRLPGGESDSSFERVDTRRAVMLGQPTDVTKFRTSVSADGEERTVIIWVTSVRSGDDVVIAVGVHPKAFPGQRVSFFRFLYALEHPSE
jgi:hypothetical protein